MEVVIIYHNLCAFTYVMNRNLIHRQDLHACYADLHQVFALRVFVNYNSVYFTIDIALMIKYI